jgi:hypothetical protein
VQRQPHGRPLQGQVRLQQVRRRVQLHRRRH